MEETKPARQQRKTGFIVLNPVAGKGKPEQIKDILQSTLGEDQYHLCETTGDGSLPDVVQTAVNKQDYAWVAAIGGDGTVSQMP
jgi:diacylglycerol kinase family enzyme